LDFEEQEMTKEPDFMKVIDEYFEKNKPPTLYQIIHDELGYSHDCTAEIIDAISKWLPKENTRPSYDTMQWDKCVKFMRSKLQ
jgi:hypothetical protein